jgi:phosphatidylglycerophosphate synthase
MEVKALATIYSNLKRVLEPANWLTLVRLPLAALLWMDPGNTTWMLYLLAGAAVSDMLDGRVAKALRARRLELGDDDAAVVRSHALGAWLDPLCDKTFVLSTLAVIYVGLGTPLWMLFAVAARELVLVPCALVYHSSPSLRRSIRFDFRAGTLGKLATVAQFSAVVAIVANAPYLAGAAILTAILGLAAAVFYLRKAINMARWLASNEWVCAK